MRLVARLFEGLRVLALLLIATVGAVLLGSSVAEVIARAAGQFWGTVGGVIVGFAVGSVAFGQVRARLEPREARYRRRGNRWRL